MIAAGTRVGPYVVHSLLGQGGMGEVYRAHDARLKRDVALKLLPPAFAADAERIARFEREAQILASLNHPHIAGVHGIEDTAGTRALVMELVEGPTLAARLASGPVPVDEALAIARQIAAALEAAHDAGIVHRDLKPANVKVRTDGTVKVLDFGLAKAIDPTAQTMSPVSSPTMTSPAMTQAGMIVGSAAYMSPEQARGRAVDKRTDIWAFGCVLYEILTGAAAFPGDNITDVMASVVRNDPDWHALPADTPPRVRRLLARCLQKDPRARLRDIGDARLELEAPDDDVEPATAAVARATGFRSARRWAMVAAGLGALSMALAGALLTGYGRRAPAAGITTRLSLTFPDASEMHLALSRPSLAVSPDGRSIVYTAAGGPESPQLWIRDLDEYAARPLPGTRNARMAVFSPDGRWIAFVADEKLKKMPLAGGPPIVVTDAPLASGATWTTRDEIVFALRPPFSTAAGDQDFGLWRVAAAGGQRQKISSDPVYFPDALPDGRSVLVTLDNPAAATSGDLTIAVVELASGAVTRLVDGGTYARYVPTGHLVYLRNGELIATPFDAATLTAGNDRVPVVSDAYFDPSLSSGNYAFSAAGTLAYVPGDGSQFRRSLVVADGESVRPLIDERRFYHGASLSPDGRHVAVLLRSWKDDVWTIDIERGALTKVTTGGLPAASLPLWSPDGRRLIVSLIQDGVANLFAVPSDGTGSEERLSTSRYLQSPVSFTPDGRTLVYTEHRPETASDVLMLSLDDGSVRPLVATRFREPFAAISPDGRWIAYQSDRSGQYETYVAAFPAMQPTVQVSNGGGANPVWSRNSRRLFFNRGSFAAIIEAVDIAGDALTVSRPRSIGQYSLAGGFFAVMPDERLLFVTGTGNDGSTSELHVVLNWFDELTQKVPASR